MPGQIFPFLSVTDQSPPLSRCKTVLYTVNRKPIICENPFRKVFAARKEFYQSREQREKISPETSSKKLIWRHNNHNCKRFVWRQSVVTLRLRHCDIITIVIRLADSPPRCEDVPPQKYFTLNANIEPFDPFIIKHDLSAGLNLNRYSWCSPLIYC